MEIAPPRKWTFGEAVRRRPGMYVGNPGPEALQHLIDELVSNAIDQFLMGQATFVGVRVHDDGGIEVSDDGAGLPFDQPAPDDSASLATHWFTTPHHTARADGHAPHVHVHSQFGIGLPIANHCSHRLVCRAWRNGALWEQTFADGMPDASPRVVATGDGRGTRIAFWPDGSIVGASVPA
ncbi:MAG TPA: ATP-binding protein, partial [Tahibacter sp.]|nr:ATP-binding protein [Tahibacter sp.]